MGRKTLKEFSYQQWFKKKKDERNLNKTKDAERKRLSRCGESVDRAEKRKEKGREKMRESRTTETTPEKRYRLENDRVYQIIRREQEFSEERNKRHEAGRAREVKRRDEECTAEKKERLEVDRSRKAKRRDDECTAEKKQRLEVCQTRGAKRRDEECTAEKKQRLEVDRSRKAKRRDEECTAEKKQRLEVGQTREAKRREAASSSAKGRRKKADRQRKSQSSVASQARKSLSFDGTQNHVQSVHDDDQPPNQHADKHIADQLPFHGLTNDLLAKELLADPIHAFHVAMWSLENTMCENCKERSFLINVDRKRQWCERCRNKRSDPRKFTAANDMDPGEQPEELKGLTQQEEILISPAVPMMSVYRLPLGQLGYTGNIVNIPQDVQYVVDVLPRTAEESGLITFRSHGQQGSHKDFRVRREKVGKALRWLQANNARFADIRISEERIADLPVDGFIDANFIEDDKLDEAGPSGVDDDANDPHPVKQLDTDTVNFVGLDDSDHSGPCNLSISTDCQDIQEANPNPIESFIPCVFQPDTEIARKQEAAEEILENQRSKNLLKVANWPPRKTDQPVDEFRTVGYVFDCFPTLFPSGSAGDLLGDRPIVPVSTQDYFKHLINFHDGRFAKHPRFRYFALNTILRHRAMETGRVFVKKNRDVAQLTVKELQELSKADKKTLMNQILRYGQSFPGSKPFWMSRRSDLLAMLKQKSELPTVFFTVSAADCQWPDLHRHIPGHDQPDYSKFNAVAENPMLCNIFFFLRIKKILKFMQDRFGMVDYWGRFEYQHRGSIHFHGLAWFSDAPDINEMISKTDAEKDLVVKYFDNLLTAVNPGLKDDGSGRVPSIKTNPASVPYFLASKVFGCEDSDYIGIIMYCHRHTCRVGYCCKEVKGVVQPCRFKFPKELVPVTNLEVVEDARGRKKCSINLKRNDRWINSHTKAGALVNRANTDFQPCIDVDDVASYCAKYVTKSEKIQNVVSVMLGQLALSPVPIADPVRKLAQKALIRLISDRDYSAQETIHLLLSLPLYVSSRTFVPLFLSGEKELKKEDGEAVLVSNPVDRYCKRSKGLDNLSLFELYQQYRYDKKSFVKITGKTNIVVPKGLRKVSKDSPAYEEYCERYLMLHKHFRTLADLKGSFATYAEAYADFVKPKIGSGECFEDIEERVVEHENAPQENHQDPSVEDRVRDCVFEDYADLLKLDPEFKCFGAENFDWCEAYSKQPQAYDRVKEFHRSLKEQAPSKISDNSIDDLQLNPEQEKAFDAIKDHLLTTDSAKEPLRTIVTGSAGTGKTVFIKKLKRLLGEKLFVMAPTGVAACNAEGLTVNSALGIPAIVSEESFTEKTGASMEAVQERFEKVEYVILEEVSMIGLRKLCMIDKRLREAFPSKSNMLFGGRSVILIGDFGQLPPIGDYSLFRFVSRHWSEIAPKLSSFQAQGLLAYTEFKSCFKFSTVVRQSGDTVFRDLLQRVRVGEVTREDYDLLRTRFRGNCPDEADFLDAVHLFTSRKEVAEFNLNKLLKLAQPVAVVEGVHTGGAAAKKASTDDAGNLEASVLLAPKAKIMLTANLNVSKGLCNGTMGEVVDIIYRSGGPPELPLCVMCHFEDYSGPAFFPDRPKLVPVVPITRRFQLSGNDCSRTNVPLRLAWAITIHKAQGLTLPKVVLNLGKSEFNSGLAFVGLSRVRQLSDMLLDPFGFSRLGDIGAPKKDGSNPITTLRREDSRLEAMSTGDIDNAMAGFSKLRSDIESAKAVGAFKKSKNRNGGLAEQDVRCKAGPLEKVKTVSSHQDAVKNEDISKAQPIDQRCPGRVRGKRAISNVAELPFRTPLLPSLNKRRRLTEDNYSHDDSIVIDQSSFLRPETSFVREDQINESFVFEALGEQRMRQVCNQLGDIEFHSRDEYGAGGSRHVGFPPKKVIPVSGDGHCFYHVISRALTGRNNYHLQLRNHLARYYQEGRGGLGVPQTHIQGVMTNAWADGQDARSMSRLLAVPIFMYAKAHYENGVSRFRWFPCGSNDEAHFRSFNGGIYIFHCDVNNEPAEAGNHFTLVTDV